MTPSANDQAPDEAAADEAMQWYLRLKDDSATEEDQRAFQAWLDRDPRHARAYRDTEQLWQEIEAPARLMAARRNARSSRRLRPIRGVVWATAACVLVAMFVVAGIWRDPGLIDRLSADIATRPGETREVTLADGSRLFVGADSAVDVSISNESRELTLRRGRLWVDVMADGQRAFSVVTGMVHTRVMGTRFAVERRRDAVTVTVEEGRVRVAVEENEGPVQGTVLGADQQVVATDGVLGATRSLDAPAQLAWHHGRLIFDRATLAEVAVQLERMLPGRVISAGGRTADVRLSGSFPIDDPDAILSALKTSLRIKVTRIPGVVIWLSPPADRDEA
ncbi:FecR family protein [Halomonas elongata]|uniref:FecR family protein n=1 Tax=Halomonas elongata TaxID=2746 RepID=UPI00255AEA57|nr:FecR domain-containing protein [Halomonas elongata]MDL4863721.1 FecR domain-containing protein [Halomonas elongata]